MFKMKEMRQIMQKNNVNKKVRKSILLGEYMKIKVA